MIDVKTKLIHWLGGYTKEETEFVGHETGFNDGYKYAYEEIYAYLKDLNGKSAKGWCDSTWDFVQDKVLKHRER